MAPELVADGTDVVSQGYIIVGVAVGKMELIFRPQDEAIGGQKTAAFPCHAQSELGAAFMPRAKFDAFWRERVAWGKFSVSFWVTCYS